MKSEGFLSREECTAMKGIAIVAIMLHNYCHWLKGIVRENEYTWQQWKCDQLWQHLLSPDDLLPLHLLSFFGHYGVPVFLFVSGFGMVMKYESPSAPATLPTLRFMRYNYLKLFRIFIVGFVLFTMLDAITPGMHRYQAGEVVAMLGMYANLLPHPSELIWPGPYWYFSLTLQLYLLYRLVLYRRRSWWVVMLVAICWLWQVYYLDEVETLERLRYNFVGGMLPFGMGVIFARWKPSVFRLPSSVFLLPLTVVAVVALSFSPHTWLWVPVFVVMGTIALAKLLPSCFQWLGSISAAIFVTHPMVRKIFVRPYLHDDLYAGLLLYVAATLILSWVVKKIIDRIPSPKL